MSLIVAKIGLIGDSGIGKTTLMNKLTENSKFDYKYIQPTIGVDFCVKPFIYKKDKEITNINWNLYDTAGQERFSPIVKTYYRICNIIILGFSDNESLERIDNWIEQIDIYNDKCKIFLVRLKMDLNDKIKIPTRLLTKFEKIYNISVIKNYGLNELVDDINLYIYNNKNKMIKREIIEIENVNLKSKCC
jgi:small GTP-binding protein